MVLVEDGLVGLTRPVQEYVPEFAGVGKDQVCVHHLLTHTSGIAGPIEGTDDFAELFSVPVGYTPRDPALHPIDDRLLVYAYEQPLQRPPGEEMRYEKLQLRLVGRDRPHVSGQALGDFLTPRIFAPLGMTDSFVLFPTKR